MHKPFLRLREGKLFLVGTNRLMKPGASADPPFVRARQRQRQVEHYWLWVECAIQWTLIYDRERGIALAPLKRPVTSIAPDAAESVWLEFPLFVALFFPRLPIVAHNLQHRGTRLVQPLPFLFIQVTQNGLSCAPRFQMDVGRLPSHGMK